MKSIYSTDSWLHAQRICLASASPRRLTLLQQVGLHPHVRPADLDESRRADEKVRDYVQRMAISKACQEENLDCDLVIGADTIVVVDDELLGKPAHVGEAQQMLTRISGRAHQVLTAVAVHQPASQRCRHLLVESRVWIKSLDPEEIDAYIATGEPLDKAGSYGIQGLGAAMVTRLEGSCSGVAGLPLHETLALLREFA
ncbi:MAG: Maf family protein [Magnetococcus sp. MYC-9]